MAPIDSTIARSQKLKYPLEENPKTKGQTTLQTKYFVL